MAPKVWFVTGASSGFGEAIVQEVLARGDKAIATARKASELVHLSTVGADVLELDVTSAPSEIENVANEAISIHGRIDFLINSAGYALLGTVEELPCDLIQNEFRTNFFGLLNVTRAFLPQLRKQKNGVIGNISSVAAWAGWPDASMYCASKWAVSGLTESMAPELAEFGIKICSIDPGYFRTKFMSPTSLQTEPENCRIEEYNGTVARQVRAEGADEHGTQRGDVKKAAKVIVDVLGENLGRKIPLHLALGADAYEIIEQKCKDTLRELELWKDISCSTDHDIAEQ